MFDSRIYSPGSSRAPKAEFNTNSMTVGSGSYTQNYIYLFPMPRGSYIKFNQYELDMFLIGAPPDINFMMGVYERHGKLFNSTYTLVPGTSVTVNNQTIPFQSVALGATVVLQPGHYYIAFIFEENSFTLLSSPNALQMNAWVRGDWIYYNNGSLGLPATIPGAGCSWVLAGANLSPFWCATIYTGDMM